LDSGQHRFDEQANCEPTFRGLVAYSVEKVVTFRRLVNMSTMVKSKTNYEYFPWFSRLFRRLVGFFHFPPISTSPYISAKYAVRERKVENVRQFIFARNSKFRKKLGPLK
jgi:hypothetical protein